MLNDDRSIDDPRFRSVHFPNVMIYVPIAMTSHDHEASVVRVMTVMTRRSEEVRPWQYPDPSSTDLTLMDWSLLKWCTMCSQINWLIDPWLSCREPDVQHCHEEEYSLDLNRILFHFGRYNIHGQEGNKAHSYHEKQLSTNPIIKASGVCFKAQQRTGMHAAACVICGISNHLYIFLG